MKLHAKLMLAIGALVLCLVGGTGAAGAAPKAKSPKYDSGPPPHAKAYGYRCKGQSKEHVKGEKGTAFSRCVKAVNQMRKEQRQQEREELAS